MDENLYLENIRKNIKAIKSTGNLSSSKSLEEILRASIDADSFPPSDTHNVKQNEVIYMIFDSSPIGLSYIDLTSRFPYFSARGNEYILVAYHYDANVTLAQPLKK